MRRSETAKSFLNSSMLKFFHRRAEHAYHIYHICIIYVSYSSSSSSSSYSVYYSCTLGLFYISVTTAVLWDFSREHANICNINKYIIVFKVPASRNAGTYFECLIS